MCGQRGLMPNTENQTFMISVPKKLRNHYDHILRPLFVDQVSMLAVILEII